MGIALLSEEEYRALQQVGSFDNKTSSWVHTPPEIRKLGGAQSYYGARGFRGSLRVPLQ